MEKLILLVADFANVDRAGKLNVLGAFNRIYAIDFPAKHSLMHLVIKLGAELGDVGTKTFVAKFVGEDGAELLSFPPIEFKVPSPNKGETPETNFILQIRDLEIPQPGKYAFHIFVDGEEKGILPVTVDQFTPPQE